MSPILKKTGLYLLSIAWNYFFGLEYRKAKVATAVRDLQKYADHMYDRDNLVLKKITELERKKGQIKDKARQADDYAHHLVAASLANK